VACEHLSWLELELARGRLAPPAGPGDPMREILVRRGKEHEAAWLKKRKSEGLEVTAIAYDPARSLAWVTLTERNEVVGFDVRGGEPAEKYRFPTVRQPNSITVDERTARVFVGSATGEGIQVIQP